MARETRRKNCATALERAGGALTRREFARKAAAAAAVAVLPGGGEVPATKLDGPSFASPGPQEATGPVAKLTAEARAEAEAKIEEIMRRYGAKLNDTQKADVRRLVFEAQEPIETLRRFPLGNSDEPATVLHLAGPGVPHRTSAPAAPGPRKPSGKGD